MKTLTEIRQQLQTGEFEFTRHAFKRAIERNISDREIIEERIRKNLHGESQPIKAISVDVYTY